MFEDLNLKIQDLQQKKRQKEKLQSLLKSTKNSLNQEKVRLMELKEKLIEEEEDVKKLEKPGIAWLIAGIKGDRSEKLDKEKQEYLTCKLRYDHCINSIEHLRSEQNRLEDDLHEFDELDSEYQALIKEKEHIISSCDNDSAKKFMEYSLRLANLKSDEKELKEAIKAGESAKETLNTVLDYLNSAHSWGTYDMLGGGFIATAVKRGKIDDANAVVQLAQRKLRKFQHELKDVKFDDFSSVEIGSFEGFADYFFDSFIVDWLVQSKINNSIDKVDEIKNKVFSIIMALKNRLNTVHKIIESLTNEMYTFIENA